MVIAYITFSIVPYISCFLFYSQIQITLQVGPIKDLSEQARTALQLLESSGNENIPLQAMSMAHKLKSKYSDVLHSYADVHAAINQGEHVDDTGINKAGMFF